MSHIHSRPPADLSAHPSARSSGADYFYPRRYKSWFWDPLLNHWPAYSQVLIATFFINVFALVIPIYTMNVYDRVIPIFAQGTLFVLTLGVGLALLFDLIFKILRIIILDHLALKIGNHYDDVLMAHLLRLPAGRLKMSVGEQANLFRELQGLRDFYASRMAPAIVDFPFFLLFLLAIYSIAPAIAVVPLVASVIILAVNGFIQVPLSYFSRHHFASLQEKSAILIETLNGGPTYKMTAALDKGLARWNNVAGRYAEAVKKNQLYKGMAERLSLFLTQGVTVAVLFVGVYEIQAQNLTIGGLIACTILAGRAVAPMMSVSAVIAHGRQTRDILTAIDKIFALPSSSGAVTPTVPLDKVEGRIDIQNLDYIYDENVQPVLRDINLTIPAGQRVAIIGPAGAGKSTLARIIAGVQPLSKGTIQLDYHPYHDIMPDDFGRYVGVVPQDPFFFSASVRDNILMGHEGHDEALVVQALEISGLGHFIKQPNFSLDMPVGENGHNLSGGQKQAIALARMILRNPQIVIMDEPSNGMDHTLETHLRDRLPAFLEGKTVIIITHRTTLLPLVERVIMLDQGTVTLDGKRDDVMKKLSGGAA